MTIILEKGKRARLILWGFLFLLFLSMAQPSEVTVISTGNDRNEGPDFDKLGVENR